MRTMIVGRSAMFALGALAAASGACGKGGGAAGDETPTAQSSEALSTAALAWLTGDVNNDAKTDLIVPFDNGTGRLGLRVYRSNGTGYAATWSSTNVGQGTNALAWLTGDVNGDRKTDVLQPWSNNGHLGLIVYQSNGTGYVNTWGTSDLGTSSDALAWLTGDVDRDGKSDLIQPYSNNGRLGINVYRSDGTRYAKSWGAADMGQGAGALAWLTGDVNGDGKTDVIQPWSNGGRLGIIVYQSNGTGYANTWSTADIGQSADALAWLTGDVNHDGKVDLIQPFANGTRLGVRVYESNGRGFAPSFVSTDMGQGAGAIAWLTGDFDKDGKTDLLQPWFNNGALGLIDYHSTGAGLALQWGTADIGQRADALAWLTGDVNGDGRTELIQPWANHGSLGINVYGATNGAYALGWSSGNVTAGPKEGSLAPTASMANALVGNDGWRTDVHTRAFADVNGDGKKDVVGFGDAGVWLALSNGPKLDTAHFVVPELGTNRGWTAQKHVRLTGDISGDGKDDIVAFGEDGVWTVLSTGTGFGTARRVLDEFSYQRGWRIEQHVRTLADVNGDGKKDIVAFGNDGVWLSFATGDGNFAPPAFVIADFGASKGWDPALHVRTTADVNGDGRDDIVAFGYDGVWTALSTGTGFAPQHFVLAGFGYNAGGWRVDAHSRQMADVDGDGKADIVGFGQDGVWTAHATGDGGFAPAVYNLAAFGAADGWSAKTPRLLGDINGDGYRDIVGYRDQGQVYASLGGPTGFGPSRLVLPSYVGDPATSALADVDGDGMDDLTGFGWFDVLVARGRDTAPVLPRPILETDMKNAPAPANPAVCGGQKFLENANPPWEWTPMLPDGAGDEYGVDTAVSGQVFHPEQSEKDMPFTHPFYDETDGDPYDFEYYVAPDGRYSSVLSTSNTPGTDSSYHDRAQDASKAGVYTPGVIGMETDAASVPPMYRAHEGDRVALFGRWIEDCGHEDFHKEIHPPLVQVVARQDPPQGDMTKAMIIGRPFLVSQDFGDGGLRAHLIKQIEYVAELRSQRIEAHPRVLRPFNGVHILRYVVRPPTPRSSPNDRLLASFHFTLRSGVAVQATDAGDDTVAVTVVMNSAAYPFDVNTLFPGRTDAYIDVSKLDDDAKDILHEVDSVGSIAAVGLDVLTTPIGLLLLPSEINLFQALNKDFLADRYPTPHARSAEDGTNVAWQVPVSSLTSGIGTSIDNAQPFPIYGWMNVEWERH